MQKLQQLMKKLLQVPKVGIEKVKAWYEKHKEKLKEISGEEYVNSGLESCLETEAILDIDFSTEGMSLFQILNFYVPEI